MWAAVTVSPERPNAGQQAEVLIRTFATFGPDALGPLSHDGPIPAPSDSVLVLWGVDYPFDVEALGPDGELLDVVTQQDAADASLHRGIVTFPSPGNWTVRLPQFPGPVDAPGTRLIVTVASGESPGVELAALAAAGGLGLVAGVAAAMVMRRRSLRRMSDADGRHPG